MSERYQLHEPLGHGGQGHTFAATDRETGRRVAVKVIELRGGAWKDFDLFERECRVLQGLAHPGIPAFLDTFADEEQGRYALVMELVEGRTIKQLLDERHVFAEEQIWRLLAQVLEILAYLHGLRPPVIHRDIKPANLILTEDDHLYLVDFGGVRVALRVDGGSTVVGTFGYMAPEQLHGEATAGTDIYALGATIAALASGTEADKLPRKGLKIDLSRVMSAGALRGVLDRMLEPEPERRLADVSAVRQLMDELRRGEPDDGRRAAGGRADAALEPAPPDERLPRTNPFLNVFGTIGWAALTVIEVLFLPIVNALLALGWSNNPRRLTGLKRNMRSLRRGLREGRQTMEHLAAGRRPPPRPQLPPHRRRRDDRERHRQHRAGRRGRRRRRGR